MTLVLEDAHTILSYIFRFFCQGKPVLDTTQLDGPRGYIGLTLTKTPGGYQGDAETESRETQALLLLEMAGLGTPGGPSSTITFNTNSSHIFT